MLDISSINKEGTKLREHQKRMFDMLVYLDRLCSEHGIKYFLSGGTLLGTVRHKGFIPWDDDLDVIFLKKDLKKIHQLLLQNIDPKYSLQSFETDPYYVAPYEKLRMNGTLICENNCNDVFYKYKGIYIDLFFVEPALPFFHFISDKLQTRLVNLVHKKDFKLKYFLVHSYGSFLRNFLYPVFSKLSYWISPSYVSYPLGSYFHTQFKKDWLFPGCKGEFEGLLFDVPEDFDSMLRAQYGDYMQIPSEDEISLHINYVQFENER